MESVAIFPTPHVHKTDSKVLCIDDRYFMSLLSISQQLDFFTRIHETLELQTLLYGFKIYLLALRSSYIYIYIILYI